MGKMGVKQEGKAQGPCWSVRSGGKQTGCLPAAAVVGGEAVPRGVGEEAVQRPGALSWPSIPAALPGTLTTLPVLFSSELASCLYLACSLHHGPNRTVPISQMGT